MTKLKHLHHNLIVFLLSKKKIREYLPDSKLALSFDAATILKRLNGLNISKSPGPDLVNTKILKELAKPMTPVLSIIFKTSYESCRLR